MTKEINIMDYISEKVITKLNINQELIDNINISLKQYLNKRSKFIYFDKYILGHYQNYTRIECRDINLFSLKDKILMIIILDLINIQLRTSNEIKLIKSELSLLQIYKFLKQYDTTNNIINNYLISKVFHYEIINDESISNIIIKYEIFHKLNLNTDTFKDKIIELIITTYNLNEESFNNYISADIMHIMYLKIYRILYIKNMTYNEMIDTLKEVQFYIIKDDEHLKEIKSNNDIIILYLYDNIVSLHNNETLYEADVFDLNNQRKSL